MVAMVSAPHNWIYCVGGSVPLFVFCSCIKIFSKIHLTPWKFNIAPENIPSQKESRLPTSNHFSGATLNFGGVTKKIAWDFDKVTRPYWLVAFSTPTFQLRFAVHLCPRGTVDRYVPLQVSLDETGANVQGLETSHLLSWLGCSFFFWGGNSANGYTPEKERLDTQNYGLEKVTPFKSGNFWYLC